MDCSGCSEEKRNYIQAMLQSRRRRTGRTWQEIRLVYLPALTVSHSDRLRSKINNLKDAKTVCLTLSVACATPGVLDRLRNRTGGRLVG